MTSRITLTDAERAYLHSQTLGRLATVDERGAPQNSPVGVFLDDDTDEIVVGGYGMGQTRKYRNVERANPNVALVVDDVASRDPWRPRGIELRGTAVALADVDPPSRGMSREVLRITPTWIVTWGVEAGVEGRQVRRAD
jgi:pyridoxamine 5'-phosphate oxidase family protein